jgi:TolB-like protein/tetratricopeptide (TPR) repeat protein
MQVAMAKRNADLEPHRRMHFRIGITLGDIIFDATRIYGDGINVAARLQSIAEPGGICVSGKVFEEIRGKIDLNHADLGRQSLKNIDQPVRVFRLRSRENGGAVRKRAGDAIKRWRSVIGATLVLVAVGAIAWLSYAYWHAANRMQGRHEARLSVVVLPFSNLSGDPANDYLTDSLTADAISDLARVRGSFVIARNTALTYKGKSVDPKQIGRDLGVRYVLDGSARRAGASVRVDAQLIDVETGGVVWADRLDGDLSNLQSLNEEITGRLARTLSLSLVELAARKSAHVEKPDVADLILRGRAAYYTPVTVTRERFADVRAYFQSALALAPEAVDALIGVALVDVSEYSIFNTPIERLAYAEDALNKALIIEPNHAWGRYARAYLFSMTNRLEAGRDEALVAISLDPSLVDAHARLAQIETFLGRPQQALERLEAVRRLSPRDPFSIYWDLNRAHAHVLLGNDEQVVAICRKAVSVGYRPHYLYWYLITALAHLDRMEEAQAALAELRQVNPKMATIAAVRRGSRSQHAAYVALRQRMFDGVRKAGMPEE